MHKHTNLFTVHIYADNNVLCRWKECCGYGTCCRTGRACHYHQPRQQNPVFRQERKTVRDLLFFSFYFVHLKTLRFVQNWVRIYRCSCFLAQQWLHVVSSAPWTQVVHRHQHHEWVNNIALQFWVGVYYYSQTCLSDAGAFYTKPPAPVMFVYSIVGE